MTECVFFAIVEIENTKDYVIQFDYVMAFKFFYAATLATFGLLVFIYPIGVDF
jgi:hypothetical protein